MISNQKRVPIIRDKTRDLVSLPIQQNSGWIKLNYWKLSYVLKKRKHILNFRNSSFSTEKHFFNCLFYDISGPIKIPPVATDFAEFQVLLTHWVVVHYLMSQPDDLDCSNELLVFFL